MRRRTHIAVLRAAVAATAAFVVPPAAAQDAGPLACPAGQPAYAGIVFEGGAGEGGSGYLDAATLQGLSDAIAGCSIAATDPELAVRLTNVAYDSVPAPLAFARLVGRDGDRLRVELVEISYGEVRVEAATTRPGYVTARAGARPGALADVAALDRRLSQLPEVEDIRIEADLVPGAEVGTSDLILTVEEPDPLIYTLSLDNYGSPVSGRAQAAASVRIASLTGRRDPLGLSLSGSEERRSAAVTYGTPLGADGVRLGLSLAYDRGGIAEGGPILEGLRSETVTAQATVTVPLVAETERVDGLSFGLLAIADKLDLGDFRLLDQRTDALRIGSNHVRRFPGRGVLAASQDLTFGRVDDRVARIDEGFTIWSGRASALWKLGKAIASADARVQVADDIVPSALRFAVAGPTAVRGFDPDDGSGNAGWVLRTEISPGEPVRLSDRVSVQPYLLLDAGEAYERIGTRSEGQGLLTAGGVGARWDFGPVELDSFVATPFADGKSDTDGDVVAGVSLVMRF